jgi:excisionase family DNA binding protein
MQDPITDELVIAPQHEEDRQRLRDLADAFGTTDTVFVRSDDGDVVALPESAREGLGRLVSYLAAGMAVTVKPYDEILTTREAAELLGMSRPYLVHLLETDAIRIPVQKVGPGAGGHRRIRLSDVLAYRQGRAAENQDRVDRSLEQLSTEAGENAQEAPLSATAAAQRSAR